MLEGKCPSDVVGEGCVIPARAGLGESQRLLRELWLCSMSFPFPFPFPFLFLALEVG